VASWQNRQEHWGGSFSCYRGG